MPRGGKRAGAGRPLGGKTVRGSARAQVMRLVADKQSPLDYVVSLASDSDAPTSLRLEACRICLPFLFPRLSAMASVVARVDGRDPQAILNKLQAALHRPAISSEPATIEAEAEPVAA